MYAPLAAHSLADLPRDPRTWLPAEVSIYLFHVFANVPVPVMETLAQFVASAHLSGKAFLGLRERDLEQKGMNTRWRRLLCEAARRLRRDALRRRIWSGREDEWSGSDDGASECPREAEQSRVGSQLAQGDKRVMTITLKRIQNRMYVKDAVQGLEPLRTEEKQRESADIAPRRKETTSWRCGGVAEYTSPRGLVSPPVGEGYVRGRVTSLTSQSGSSSVTTRQSRGKDAFSQSYTADSIVGTSEELPEAPSGGSNALQGDNAQALDGSAPATSPFASADEDQASIAEVEEDNEDVSPWSPLEQGLIDAILDVDLSRSEESDTFQTSHASSISSSSALAGDVDDDPIKRDRLSMQISVGSPWRTMEVEDDKVAADDAKHEDILGHDSAVDGDSLVAPFFDNEYASASDADKATDVCTEGDVSDEDRYQDSPTDESAFEPILNSTAGRLSPSQTSYFHPRTLSRASTRSSTSFLSAFEGSADDTMRSQPATAPHTSGILRYAPRRNAPASVATLFGLGIAEVELDAPSDVQEELLVEPHLFGSAEAVSSAVLNVETDDEEEQGRFDDPAEETEYTSSADSSERSITGDSRLTSSRDGAPILATPSNANPPRPDSTDRDPGPDDADAAPSSSCWQTLLRSTLDQLHYVRGCMGLRALPAYAVALGVGAALVLGSAVLKEVVGRRGAKG